MAKNYTLSACEELISSYIEKGGESIELEPGVLGLGLTVCFGDGLKTAIIREFYINPWASGHTVRFYNNMPKKYERMIENWYSKEDE